MTDLSTTNLKHLLDKATPGPWKHDDKVGEILGAYYEKNGIGYIPTVGYADDYNADLIALAPELAEEVLRIRKALDELYSAVVRTAEDCAIRDDHEGKLAARVAQSVSEQLFRILLEEDHDE